MADVSLLIKVLADTSSANASFTSMGKGLAAVLGVGAAGGASVAVIQAASDFQSSMAKIQQAYNSADFAPGTQNYSDAAAMVLKESTTMATSFEDVAASMAQASKITDQYGAKLPTDKVNEFVDANLRLKASSQDSVDALTSGQHMAMLDKMFSSTDFKGTASMVAALSTQHPQDEETLWQAALGIAQVGAPLGVTMPQALGVGNYLSDVGGGGQSGGSSIGRMLLRMDTSADQVLDPQSKYADVRKNRDAQEKLDDLRTSLREAEAKHAEMYGQHGLKTQYRQHPSEVMAADDRIAKLNREIADQQENILHENDPNRSRPRGQMNVAEMAKTAGQTSDAFAELFKANPIDALLDFTRGLHELPSTERGAAMTKAGITNVRDQKTISLLSDQPDSVQRMIDMAQGQQANPTAIDQISNVGLSTTAAKFADLHNELRAKVVEGGEPLRQVTDTGIDKVMGLIQSGNWDALEKNLGDAASKFDQLNAVLAPVGGVLGPVAQALAPLIGFKLLGMGGAGGAAAGAAGRAGGAAGALGAGEAGGLGVLLGNVGTAAAAGWIAGSAVLDENLGVAGRALAGKNFVPSMDEIHGMDKGNTITIGDLTITNDTTLDQLTAAVTARLTAAWNAAMHGTPVSGPMGGAYNTGSAPR